MPRGAKKNKYIEPDFHRDPDANFPAEAIVAILDPRNPEGYTFVKLQDNVLDNTDQTRVSFLQLSSDNGMDVSYIRFSEGDIKVDLILKEVPYQIEKQKGRNKPPIYHIEKALFDSLATMAKVQQGSTTQPQPPATQSLLIPGAPALGLISVDKGSEAVESSSESSEEEEEEEEEEVGQETVVNLPDGTVRVFKRVKGPRREPKKKKKEKKPKEEAPAAAVGDMEIEKKKPKMKTSRVKKKKKIRQINSDGEEETVSEDDSEDAEYLPDADEKSSGKKGKASRTTKKKKGETGIISTKKADFSGDEGDEEDEAEEEDEDEKPKKKKRAPKKSPAEKGTKAKKGKKMPDTYKKGKFNPNVEEVSYHDLLHNTSDAIIDYGCVKTNNKNLIRAVQTKNYSLLEKILKNNYFLSTLHQQWAPENDITALELAIKQKDIKAIKAILDCEYARTLRFTTEPPMALRNVDTGNVSKAAFGVEVRKVNVMRGGREGNNAFTHDSQVNYINLNDIFEYPLDKETIEYLRLKAGNNEVYSRIDKLVLQGDRANAGYLVSLANAAGGYGFNYLHEEVLTKDKASELTPNIKKVSVTKKVIGNSVITPIHCAAINPNTEILETLLALVPDYSIPDEKMRKPVHYAACCEKPGPLRLLLSKGVDPREKDKTGLTPFMYACYYGRAQNVEVLMKEANVDPNYKTKDGTMGIHWAVQRGHLEVLKVLAKNGVNMTVKGGKSKMTPLHYAAAYGHFDCLKFLLDNKAKVLAKDKLKRTPLTMAVRNGNLEIASYLLRHGADYEQADSSNNYPIHYAAAYGFTECIELLVKAGANVNAKNSWNLTPLTVAMLKNNFHCVKTLFSYPETDVNAKDDNGRTLVSLLVTSLSEDNFDKIAFLVKDRNCNINEADRQGMSPLHYACQLKAENHAQRDPMTYIIPPEALRKVQQIKLKLVKLLLEFGADINAKTTNQEVPMLFAISYFDSELIELLLDHKGIDLTFQDRQENNIYRLLFKHVLDTDEQRKLLEKVIARAGNVGNILNQEKKPAAQIQNQFAFGHYRQVNAPTNTYDPMNSNDSVFVCYKRALMNHSLDEYLNKEEHNAKEAKRQQLLWEQQKQHQLQLQDSTQSLGLVPPPQQQGTLPVSPRGSLLLGNKSPAKPGLFAQQQQQPPLGLFSNQNNSSVGGLLPSSFLMQNPNQGSGGLFVNQNNLSGGLFGSPQKPIGGLFANNAVQPPVGGGGGGGGGLFGNAQSQAFGGGGLFGAAQVQPTLSALQPSTPQLQQIPGVTKKLQPIPNTADIKLTKEEIKSYKDLAYRNFDTTITKNLLLLEKFVRAGGVLPVSETLLSREEYFHDPRFMIWVLDSFKPDLNVPNTDGNTGLFSLIYKRNRLNLTPNGKKFLIDYLAATGTDIKVLEKFSDFKLFLELLNKFGANFNFRNKDGVSPILYLLRDRDLANAGYLEDLINYGADVHNAEDNKGSTPFLEAIYAYDVPVIEKLIALDVDVNHKDKAGKAPLHYIAEIDAINAMDTAKIVLKASNVQIDIKDDVNARTPLHLALLKSARGLVKVLLKAGANPNETDKDWNNALYFATQVGDLVLMREVSEKISDPNFSGYSGDSPLHLAIKNGKPEHVEFLLKIGANPNAKDHKGRTALMAAVMTEKVEIVRLLLQNGANPNERDEFDRTSLHYAVNNSKPEQMFEMEDVLIRNGSLINAEDMYGRTPLHYAFTAIKNNPNFHNQNDPVETVTSLCAVKDINLDHKDRRGRRPLHYAAENGAYICILLIIKRQITLDEADADGNTPLALALQSGHKDTAAILIQNSVNVTNMIHRINNENYLYVHPKDKNYDDVVAEEEGSQGGEESEEEIDMAKSVSPTKGKPSTAKDNGMEIENNKDGATAEAEKANEDEEEEEPEDKMDEEDDDVTEELDEGDAKARNLETQDLGTPDEALTDVNKEKAAAEKAAQEPKKYYRGQVQPMLDSFFAVSIRRGWQGIAYLLLQNGFNLMEAIKDALNEGQFRYVLALMTKIQDSVLRQVDHKKQNLFHVFAIRGHKAPNDLTTKIFDGLMMRGVDYKAIDSNGRTPLHYAAETNFLFLENGLLEHKVDPNILDNNGNNILHLAIKTNQLTVPRLNKYFTHGVQINVKFWNYGREISPLHYIAERGDKELEKEILRLGADPNIEDSQGITPLQKIFIQNNLSLDRLKLYISYYADLNRVFTLTFHQNKEEIKKTYTLLIYAAEKGWSYFEDQLLMHGANASIENNEDKTAFEIALAQASHDLTLERLQLYILNQAPLRKAIPCKIRKKIVKVTPVLYLMNLKDKVPNLHILKALLDAGVSINDADQDGWTAVIYAVRRNLMFFLQLFLSCPNLDRNMRDKQGKTPIHHLVNPMDYASYENVMMLELLARYFDVNALDDRKKPPIYYAHFQDSGVLKDALLRLGATDVKPASELQRQATSIIAGVDWSEEIDYEADAEKYIEEQELKKMEEGEIEKIPPDNNAENRHNMEVVYDDVLGPYSLFMTKVDIGKGGYGEYLFYRMQVLHDKNRDNYILFTKWGRIGDEGAFQHTPFPTKEETINEFMKIFKDKSGNEWKNKDNFQKVERKYKLLNISTKKNQRDYVKPLNLADKNLPRSRLDGATKKVMKAISDVKLFRNWFGKYHIDERILPFGKLTKDLIFEAKSILLDLRELIEDLEIRQKKFGANEEEVQDMFKLKEKIVDRSSKFYELIPDSRFRLIPVAPIDNSKTLDEKVRLVNDMLDFEVSSKILLGAHLRMNKKHPLDYCFEALNIRLLTLSKQQREYKLIAEYVKNGYPHMQPDFIVNVFALERRGEAERISQWKDSKNRTYLWHGSKLLNFMGILSQGLRIAPPEAPATGYMFGKGIYFADSFAKSYGYCSDWSYNGTDSTKLLILCEVALGDSLEQFQANYITDLAPPYKSVKGCGRVGPDPAQNIVLANGAIVPIGTQMNYKYKDPITLKDIHPVLNYNEYIVYDISQVRMRYLVQVKQ